MATDADSGTGVGDESILAIGWKRERGTNDEQRQVVTCRVLLQGLFTEDDIDLIKSGTKVISNGRSLKFRLNL